MTVGLTIPNRATAFLQRLANPSEPWHIRLNPYITVDWAPIDLHIYNGEAAGGEADVDFISRERSGPTAPSDFNIWTNRVDFLVRVSGACFRRRFVSRANIDGILGSPME